MSSIGSDYANQQKAMNEAAQEADDKRQRNSRRAIAEAREAEQTANKRASEVGRDYEVQIGRINRKNETLLSQKLQSKDQQLQNELEENSQQNRVSRAAENTQLRDQVRETSRYKNEIKGEYAKARSRAIEDVESEFGDQTAQLNSTHAMEIAKLKASQKETERYLARSYDESIRDQKQKLGTTIQTQNADHSDEMGHAYREYDKAQLALKDQNQKDKMHSESRSEQLTERMSEQRNQALQNQSDIYQKTLSNQRQNQSAQIQNLERKLNDNNTTDDPGQISAAAEVAVRNQMEEKYGKTFSAEQLRNQRDRDHLSQNFEKDLGDARAQNTDQKSELIRNQNMETQEMRNTFVSHVKDVEDSKKHLLGNTEERLQKSQESMTRTNERSSQQMRRHYEDLISERETENKTARTTMAQEHDFEKRNMQRDFSMKMGDLVRSHDKQMSEERTRFEDQITELKSKVSNAQTESDKKVNQAVSDLTRGQEKRIAELESQNKQRERLLNQNHEDELEKVKRAHALMLSKKS